MNPRDENGIRDRGGTGRSGEVSPEWGGDGGAGLPDPIHTERLELRRFCEEDLDELHACYCRADVARYLLWDVRDRKETAAALARKRDQFRLGEAGESLCLAVVERESGALVGEVSLDRLGTGSRQGEIGFVFNPDFQGRGFASEAARALLRFGFDQAGLHRIAGHCDARNTASARLMERLGMRREVHLVHNRFVKGQWCDELIHALSAEEWREHSPASGGG